MAAIALWAKPALLPKIREHPALGPAGLALAPLQGEELAGCLTRCWGACRHLEGRQQHTPSSEHPAAIPPGGCCYCCAAGLNTAPTHIGVGTRHLCTLRSNPT